MFNDLRQMPVHSERTIPDQQRYDPVGDWWKSRPEVWKERLHYMALTLMDEVPIISRGDPMLIANEIEPLRIWFERLESEPDPRILAQRARRSNERKQKHALGRLIPLYASLVASHSIR